MNDRSKKILITATILIYSCSRVDSKPESSKASEQSKKPWTCLTKLKNEDFYCEELLVPTSQWAAMGKVCPASSLADTERTWIDGPCTGTWLTYDKCVIPPRREGDTQWFETTRYGGVESKQNCEKEGGVFTSGKNKVPAAAPQTVSCAISLSGTPFQCDEYTYSKLFDPGIEKTCVTDPSQPSTNTFSKSPCSAEYTKLNKCVSGRNTPIQRTSFNRSSESDCASIGGSFTAGAGI